MVGRELERAVPQAGRRDRRAGARRSHRLTREGVFFDVSFEVRAGEIVALAGLVGAGRSEVARAIFGIDRPDAGHVEVGGVRLPLGRPARRDARRASRFVPEDRRQQGLVMDLSIARNATLTRLRALAPARADPGRRREPARARVGRAPAAQVPPARGPGRLPLGRQPAEGRARASGWPPSRKLLIVDEPTRGHRRRARRPRCTA